MGTLYSNPTAIILPWLCVEEKSPSQTPPPPPAGLKTPLFWKKARFETMRFAKTHPSYDVQQKTQQKVQQNLPPTLAYQL
jgi:hypothetical protein